MNAWKKKTKRGARSPRETLADTWFDQATDLLERIRDEATEAELEEALSQQTSVSGVSVLLSRVAPAAGGLDTLASALLRGVEQQEELLDEAGGGLSRTQVADLLGIQPAAVDQRRRRGQLLAVETLGGHFLYPACQFDEGGTLPRLSEVLDSMRVEDGWMRLDMVLSALEPLGGRTPLQVLGEGPDDSEMEELRSVLRSWGV